MERLYFPIKNPDNINDVETRHAASLLLSQFIDADGVASIIRSDSAKIFFEIISYFAVSPKLPFKLIWPSGFIMFFPLLATVKTTGILSTLSKILMFLPSINPFLVEKRIIFGLMSIFPELEMVTKIFEPIVALARAEPIPSLAVGGIVSARRL